MRKVIVSSLFRKDMKTMQRRGADMGRLRSVLKRLENGEQLEPKHREHKLSGNYSGYTECHIAPDWLLVYEIDDAQHELRLSRTGTHSDLFK